MLKGCRGVLIHQRFPRAKKSIAPVDPGRNPLFIFAVTKPHPLAAVIAIIERNFVQKAGTKIQTALSVYQINEWGMNLGAISPGANHQGPNERWRSRAKTRNEDYSRGSEENLQQRMAVFGEEFGDSRKTFRSPGRLLSGSPVIPPPRSESARSWLRKLHGPGDNLPISFLFGPQQQKSG
jgi:hypothetical protein